VTQRAGGWDVRSGARAIAVGREDPLRLLAGLWSAKWPGTGLARTETAPGSHARGPVVASRS
jgi:hypothetical protein